MAKCMQCGREVPAYRLIGPCALCRQAAPARGYSLFDDGEGDEYGWSERDWQEALNPDEGDKG